LPVRIKAQANIVQLRAVKKPDKIPAYYQYLAIRQQRRRVLLPCLNKIAGCAPRPAGRVVPFRAGKSAAVTRSPHHQRLAIGE
jgi:hypothetical protein